MANYFAPQQGPFEDVPMGAPIHVDDWHGHNDNFDNGGGGGGGGGKQKNNNSKSDKKKNNQHDNDRYRQPVQSRYEGYTLDKAEALPGYKANWTRAIAKPMKFDQKELSKQVRNGNVQKHWARLSVNQRGVVNQLIEQKNIDETDRNAKWVMVDVTAKMVGTSYFSTDKPKVVLIQVILKRQDSNPALLKKAKSVREFKQAPPNEIIDLNKPPKAKKNKHGNNNNNNNFYGNNDHYDDHGFPGGNNNNFMNHPQPPPMMHPPPPPQQHFDNFQPQPMPPFDQFNPMNQAPLQDPHMPFDQFPQQGPPPFQRHGSGRPPQFHNPFQPDPHIFQPGQFDQPEIISDDFGPQGPNARERSRTRSRHRSSTNRRTSRQIDRLNDQVDELTHKINRWSMHGGGNGGSSDDTYSDQDSIFSRGPRGGGDFSPPSSPRSAYSAPRGSLDRGGARGKSSNRSRYRSQRYRDTDLVPARSYNRDSDISRRRDSTALRRRSSRPKLHHANTYDDYPMGRGTESRYLTAPHPPRRATEYDERYDFERGGGGDRRRSMAGYESFDERDYHDRGGRRRNSFGAGGRSYYN